MYSGVECVCGVTPHEYTFTPGKLQNLPYHDGNRTCDLWLTRPRVAQLVELLHGIY